MSRRTASGNAAKLADLGQFARVFRKEHAQHGEIVFFPADGIAQDHGRAIGVQRPLGIAIVFQRFAGAGDGPFLRLIHGVDHARRDRQMPFDRVPRILAHPAADLGIGLVRRAVVRIVIERGIPALGLHLGDAVTAVLHVFPESRYIRGVGQNGSRSHNRYGSIRGVFHDDAPA